MTEVADTEVRLERIFKRFGEVEAVRGVTLDIRRGEFFTFLGPSGSGKSTLLHILGGFEDPTSGNIYFRDQDVTDLPANRRGSSTVFQDLALFPHMSVGQNVEYGLKIRGVPAQERRRNVESVLDLVGLEGLYKRNVNKLSGGQRQRVALGRSLIVEPMVLLLDEPLSGLDEMLRQQMQYELKRIHDELGTTFVAVTHNQEEALSMSHRVAVLRDGRLEQVGTPRDLYERPKNAFVADFVGAANLLRGSVDAAEPEVFRLDPYRFRVEANGATRPGQGEAALLAVRPERIVVGGAASGQENRCALRLRGVTYKGADLEYHLGFPDGQELRVRVVAGRVEAVPEPGTEIEVGWAVQDASLLAAGSEFERADGG